METKSEVEECLQDGRENFWKADSSSVDISGLYI
jgi:hypothetical protein